MKAQLDEINATADPARLPPGVEDGNAYAKELIRKLNWELPAGLKWRFEGAIKDLDEEWMKDDELNDLFVDLSDIYDDYAALAAAT